MIEEQPTTYWDYIKTEQLLGLQTGISSSEDELDNDEVLFITVHQIDELWFKLVLRELVSVRNLFAEERVPEQALASAARGIRRMALLFHKIADHFSLMETMTTRDYLAFRDKLAPASGFQSAQLREIEILLGLREEQRVRLGHEASYRQALRYPDGTSSPASERVDRRLADRPSLRDALGEWLYRTPIDGSRPGDDDDAKVVGRFIDEYCEAHAHQSAITKSYAQRGAVTNDDRTRLDQRFAEEEAATRAFLQGTDAAPAERDRRSRIRSALVFIESYRELPLLAWPRDILDAIVTLEQSMIIFRQRHARMVERMIGRRTGTGGSAGVDYLDKTALTYRVFADVWAVRTLLLPKAALPRLRRPEEYGLSVGE